jgi:hypothetical protein
MYHYSCLRFIQNRYDHFFADAFSQPPQESSQQLSSPITLLSVLPMQLADAHPPSLALSKSGTKPMNIGGISRRLVLLFDASVLVEADPASADVLRAEEVVAGRGRWGSHVGRWWRWWRRRGGGGSVEEMVAAGRGRWGSHVGRWWRWHRGRREPRLITVSAFPRRWCPRPHHRSCSSRRRCRLRRLRYSNTGTSPHLVPFSRWLTGHRLASPPPLSALASSATAPLLPATHRLKPFEGRRENTLISAHRRVT